MHPSEMEHISLCSASAGNLKLCFLSFSGPMIPYLSLYIIYIYRLTNIWYDALVTEGTNSLHFEKKKCSAKLI